MCFSQPSRRPATRRNRNNHNRSARPLSNLTQETQQKLAPCENTFLAYNQSRKWYRPGSAAAKFQLHLAPAGHNSMPIISHAATTHNTGSESCRNNFSAHTNYFEHFTAPTSSIISPCPELRIGVRHLRTGRSLAPVQIPLLHRETQKAQDGIVLAQLQRPHRATARQSSPCRLNVLLGNHTHEPCSVKTESRLLHACLRRIYCSCSYCFASLYTPKEQVVHGSLPGMRAQRHIGTLCITPSGCCD